jgi:PAS domain S-box-containing protein
VRNDTSVVRTKVLIVEDESIVAKDIQQRLENLGYEVSSIASTGETAISRINKNRPDIVLMDIRLKGDMDGVKTAEKIHNHFNIPVVYLTAYADNRTLERAKVTEPYGYIIKPVEDTELKSNMELALYKHAIENKLKENEEKFRIIFENANDVIVYVDKHGRILDANKKLEEIFGYKPKEVKSLNFLKTGFLRKQDVPRLARLFRGLVKNRNPTSLLELNIMTKNGDIVIVETNTTVIRKNGKVEGYLNIIRDITKRKKAEQALEAEQQRTRELTNKIITAQEEERLYLASEIHDDLLQGLVAVLYFLQMIDMSSLDQETKNQKKELIKIIKSSIARCRGLISEIEPLREPKMGLIQALKKSIDQKFINTDIKVHLDYPRKIPKISLFTKTNVLRIIQEALMNVQKHADATEVSVKMTASKGKLRIEVKDNGIGFVPKSVSLRTTQHYGLLTMQERARLIGGEFTLSSRPGKGTTIRGVFPLG